VLIAMRAPAKIPTPDATVSTTTSARQRMCQRFGASWYEKTHGHPQLSTTYRRGCAPRRDLAISALGDDDERGGKAG
jgi:hypothetical protein